MWVKVRIVLQWMILPFFVQPVFESVETWGFDYMVWEAVPVFDYPVHKAVFPDVRGIVANYIELEAIASSS